MTTEDATWSMQPVVPPCEPPLDLIPNHAVYAAHEQAIGLVHAVMTREKARSITRAWWHERCVHDLLHFV